jgi:hypothetical protein
MYNPVKDLTPPVIFITFLNVGFFMVVQILFFYIIASKQIDVIIESKSDIINKFIEHSNETNDNIKKYLNSNTYKDKYNKGTLTEKERLRLNRKIIWLKLKPFLITVFTIITLSFITLIFFSVPKIQRKFNISPNIIDNYTLSLSDKVLIMFVLGAFSTELLFFFGMVKNYEFVGDFEVIKIIYNQFTKKYNSLP